MAVSSWQAISVRSAALPVVSESCGTLVALVYLHNWHRQIQTKNPGASHVDENFADSLLLRVSQGNF